MHYKGNLGAVEVMKFFRVAPAKLKDSVSSLLQSGDESDVKNAWKIIRHVLENPTSKIAEDVGANNYWDVVESFKAPKTMNLAESIKNFLKENTLKWNTTDADSGTQEASLQDGSKFVIRTVAGRITVSYVPKGGTVGNEIYHTPAGVPMAFDKAKKAAEEFLSSKSQRTNDVEEELGPGDEWGTDALTKRLKKETPGQVPEAFGQSGLDIVALSSKMGLKKPVVRKVDGQTSYLFRGIKVNQLRAGVENAGYREIEAFQFGDEHITDHKKGDVVLRIGPAEQGDSAWLTIKSDDLYQESLKDACWSGYKAVGTKEKDGKTVPNCVPESKEEDVKDLQALMDNPDVAFAKKNYGSVEAYKAMLQRKIDALQKNEAIVGAKVITLKPSDKLEVKYGSLIVNGRPFEMTDPDEGLDWPKSITPEGKLVTWFRGRQSSSSEWAPEEITGYYSDREGLKQESVSPVFEKHVRMVQLITSETDRGLIEAFLNENSIAGKEDQLLVIRNSFKKFKKQHG